MPTAIQAPMANDARHALAPQPAFNRRYQAVGNTLRWIQDGKRAVKLFRDDSGDIWAIPAPVLSALLSRVEIAVAERVTADS